MINVNNHVFKAPTGHHDGSRLENLMYIDDIQNVTHRFDPNSYKAEPFKRPCLFVDKGSKDTLIYFHGYDEDLFTCGETAKELSDEFSCNVMVPEYPGYSIASGKPSEKNCQCVIDAVIQHLINTRNGCIIIYGKALGAACACYMSFRLRQSQNIKIKLLALQSPFVSIRQMATESNKAPTTLLIPDMFNNVNMLQHSPCNTIFVHGKLDAVIPCHHSETLYNASISKNKRLWIIQAKGHTDLDMKFVYAGVKDFMRKLSDKKLIDD